MSVLEISRVSRETQTYDLAALFPKLAAGPFTATSVALLPLRTGPSAATVWTSVTVSSNTAPVLFAGPDADSTGAVVAPGNADVWIKTTVGTQTDAAKAGTVRVRGAAGLVTTPVDRSVPAGGTTGQVLAKASNTAYDTAWVAQTGGGGGAVSSVNTKTGAVVLSASDVGADAAGAATAAQAAAVQRANHTGTQAASTVTGLATVATTGAYADLTGKPTIPASYTDEQAQDAAAAMLTGGTHIGITFAYNDPGNALNATVASGAGGGVYYSSTYVDVSLGSSNGTTTNQTIGNGAGFTTIALNTETADLGNNFDTTTSLYTVPATGLYLVIAKLRLIDGTANFNLGVGVHTANADHPSFVWQNVLGNTTGGNRKVFDYQRQAVFTAGDQLRMYAYADGLDAPINTAHLTIVRTA